MAGGATLHLNDTDIFYTVQGPEEGIPVLLIHGFSCDQTDWSFQIDPLLNLSSFRVIAMDLRGHGRSITPNTTTAFDPATMARDSAALLHELGAGPENKAIVMGHSLGGLLVAEIAAAYPELVRGQVLVDPAYFLAPEVFIDLIPRLKEDFDTNLADFFAAVYTPGTPAWIPQWHKLRLWGADEKIMIAMLEQLLTALGPSGAEYLKAKKTKGIPRLVFTASEGGKEIEEEVGLEGDFDRIELLEVGHWIMKTAPEKTNAVLEEWLERWR